MQRNVDCLIIGAGPAGMSAACAARECGLDVTVLDENAMPGGQLFRLVQKPMVERYLDPKELERGLELVEKFEKCGASYYPQTTVWGIEPGKAFVTTPGFGGSPETFLGTCIILAPGAMERPVPFPGWTLPGIMGAGGVEVLLRSGGILPDGPIVLLGNGPLLPLLASHLIDAGKKIEAWIDTGILSQRLIGIPSLPLSLLDIPYIKKGMRIGKKILKAGIKIIRNPKDIQAVGKDHVEIVKLTAEGKKFSIPVGLLVCHEGIIPRHQFSASLNIPQKWNKRQRYWMPETDINGKTAINNIWIAGDTAYVDGGEAAICKGELAGIDTALSIKVIDQGEADFRSNKAKSELQRLKISRKWLEGLFAPNPDVYNVPDETVICRCESVTAGKIRRAIAEGFTNVNEIKRVTRCGMGQCQGRMCGPALGEIVARQLGMEPSNAGQLKFRQPLRPVTLEDYCKLHG